MLKKKLSSTFILLVVQIIIVLALLPGCFREERQVHSFLGEDIAHMAVEVDGYLEVRGENFTLTPGVYQVRAWMDVKDGQNLFLEMKCDTAKFRTLITNGAPVFAGDDYIDFEVYVLDKVTDAYVLCQFYNMDTSGLLQLDVYRTSLGERSFLFILLICFFVLDFLVVFRKRVLSGEITKKQQVVFWTLTAGVLLAFYPYLTDYYFIGADTLFHWGRVAFLKDTLLQGASFPVRIHDSWLFDHGYTVPMFYGDLFIYIPAFLMVIGFSLMTAFKSYVFVVIVATAIITYHCLKKCVKSEYPALFGTMIYILAPYCIFNIYNRSALGEFTAMTFLPLICCGMYLLYTEDVESATYKKHKWYIVWGMSAVIQCHIISTELTALLMAAFCVCCWKKTFRKQTFLQLLQTVGLVLLLNAWFWVPLLYMMSCDVYFLSKLPMEAMQSRGLLFAAFFQVLPNKGSAQTGMYNCEPAHVGAGALMMLIIYPLWKRYTKNKSNVAGTGVTKDAATTCFAILSVVTLAISTLYFPWDLLRKLPVIGYIVSSLQFPTRWMIWATPLTAVFAAFFCKRILDEGGKYIKLVLGLVALITVGSSVYHTNSIVFNYDAYYLYEEENMGTHSVGNGEYVLAEAEISDIHYHDPMAEEGLEWHQYEKVGTDVSIRLNNTTEEVLHIEIPLMGYKGYGIEAEGAEEVPYITEERGAHGDLRVAVPAGYKGTIRISYEGFAIFHVAEAVSAICLLAVAGLYFYRKRKNVKNGE